MGKRHNIIYDFISCGQRNEEHKQWDKRNPKFPAELTSLLARMEAI